MFLPSVVYWVLAWCKSQVVVFGFFTTVVLQLATQCPYLPPGKKGWMIYPSTVPPLGWLVAAVPGNHDLQQKRNPGAAVSRLVHYFMHYTALHCTAPHCTVWHFVVNFYLILWYWSVLLVALCSRDEGATDIR